MLTDLSKVPTYDTLGVLERVERFQKRSIKKSSKTEGLKMILSMIDLTTLEGKDTKGKVEQLCYKAMHPHDALPGLPTVAAVCVYPSMVGIAKNALKGSSIHVASVATPFATCAGNGILLTASGDRVLALGSLVPLLLPRSYT